jgi:hypothetical protein
MIVPLNSSLDNLLCNRFTRLKQLHWQGLFSLYAQLGNMLQIASSNDFFAARAWGVVAEDFQHPTMLLAYEISLRLLTQHLAALPSLLQHLVILKKKKSHVVARSRRILSVSS